MFLWIEQYRLTYKFSHGEKKLIKAILEGHGFREVLILSEYYLN